MATPSSMAGLSISRGADAADAADADDADSAAWTSVQILTKSPGSRVFPSVVVHEDSLYVFGVHKSIHRKDYIDRLQYSSIHAHGE